MPFKNLMKGKAGDYYAMKAYLFNVDGNVPEEYLKGVWHVQTLWESCTYEYGLPLAQELAKLLNKPIPTWQDWFENVLEINIPPKKE